MEFIWDQAADVEGNVHHITVRHPEMLPTEFIERIFSTLSGDEDVYTSFRSGQNLLVMEKTYKRRLYRIVFEMEGSAIKVKTAFGISKRRS